ncbi:NYN domain-containing protein [Bradyrhizobium sp. Cp5.3]|uniref:LabA-like NYN domain-containing protein n=1 Tax=Bradyrhizobium sp. Cp5.3 TaxID=443598 RepID=UPI000A04933E|nr:NYN domain-containing protein [Bradyrhizobium sp. Cp5.3]
MACLLPQGRIALFIDGPNLYATAKTVGFDIDYGLLLREFQGRGTLLRAFYYTSIIEDQEGSSVRPFVDWLDYNGYTVVTKPGKEFVDVSGRRKLKANMDIELAVNAMEFAGRIDEMILFAGDGNFRSLIEAVQRRGVRVTVVSSLASQPPMIADALRRQADVFADLVDLRSRISRNQSEGGVLRAPHLLGNGSSSARRRSGNPANRHSSKEQDLVFDQSLAVEDQPRQSNWRSD